MASTMKICIVGQGCAGMATAYHLLKKAHRANVQIQLDVLDAYPVGSGATGVAAGLLHPLAPSGKLLWQGMASYKKAAVLVQKSGSAESTSEAADGADPFWRATSLFRPATTDKQRRQFERNIGWNPREDVLGVRCTGDMKEGTCDGFYVPEGMVLDTKRYLEALWDLCEATARENGSIISWHRRSIRSLQDLGMYDATVIAAGAAVQEIAELRDAMSLDLCQGYTVEITKKSHDDITNTMKTHEPSILGQPYVAFHGPTRAVVGATQRHGVSSAEAFRVLAQGLNDRSLEAMKAAESLVQNARGVVPEVSDAWHINSVRCGVRAIPDRTQAGSIPYAGRLSHEAHTHCWVIAGLGARGLVYHALLGELTASALLNDADNETAFAEYPELTRWI